MARRNKRRGRKRSGTAATTGPASPAAKERRENALESLLPIAEEIEAIRVALREGDSKAALHRSKALQRRENSIEVTDLVFTSYVARIESLIREGLTHEVVALIESAKSRLPERQIELDRRTVYLEAWNGKAGKLLRPLALDPSREEAKQIEAEMRLWINNPSDVARCTEIPQEHPLRVAAAATARAFKAVTSQTVTDDEILLSEVSRRSPFSPWKLLIRAIAAFYRHDPDNCEAALAMIPPETPPARLVPQIRGLLKETAPSNRSSAASKLYRAIGSDQEQLFKAARDFERALKDLPVPEVMGRVRKLLQTCGRQRPALLERLKAHISIKGYLFNFPTRQVTVALSGPSRKDAYFWRLFARALEFVAERDKIIESVLEACAYWNRFCVHAIDEGWFPAKSPEEAAVFLHITDILSRLPEKDIVDSKNWAPRMNKVLLSYYEGQPLEITRCMPRAETYEYLDPERCFARATEACPRAEVFERWLNWARSEKKHWRPAEDAALAWSRALPKDPNPLIFLMEWAEKRNALKKASDHLKRAQGLDALNPQLSAARRRLYSSIFIRHMVARRPHLANDDIREFDAVEDWDEESKQTFLSALRWCCSALRPRWGVDSAWATDLVERMKGSRPAFALLDGMATTCKLPPSSASLVVKPGSNKGRECFQAVAAAAAIARKAQFPIAPPKGWVKTLVTFLKTGKDKGLAYEDLVSFIEVAMNLDDALVYVAAGEGLRWHAQHTAQFLFYRAMGMPFYMGREKYFCLRVVVKLGRRRGEQALVKRALDEIQQLSRTRPHEFQFFDNTADSLSSEEIEKFLEEEKARLGTPTHSEIFNERLSKAEASVFGPGSFGDGFDDDEFDDDDFDDEWDDDEWDDDEWDDDEVDDFVFTGSPFGDGGGGATPGAKSGDAMAPELSMEAVRELLETSVDDLSKAGERRLLNWFEKTAIMYDMDPEEEDFVLKVFMRDPGLAMELLEILFTGRAEGAGGRASDNSSKRKKKSKKR